MEETSIIRGLSLPAPDICTTRYVSLASAWAGRAGKWGSAAGSPVRRAPLSCRRLSLSELADQLLRRMSPLGRRSPDSGPSHTDCLEKFHWGQVTDKPRRRRKAAIYYR